MPRAEYPRLVHCAGIPRLEVLLARSRFWEIGAGYPAEVPGLRDLSSGWDYFGGAKHCEESTALRCEMVDNLNATKTESTSLPIGQ